MGSLQDNQAFSVTVVIPAYNAGRYIGRAIDSVLAQTRAAGEIVVVNDGSTDETEEVVLRYGGQVRYIKQPNSGCSAARNAGVQAAQGNWIGFLDADDEWLPRNLELQLGLLERNPQLVWTGGNYLRCLCGEHRRGPAVDPDKARRLLAGGDYHDNFFAVFADHGTGCTGSILVRRDVFLEAGMFPADVHLGEDLDLWFRIAYRWPRIGFVAEPVAVYHLNVAESATRTHTQLELRCALLQRHLELSAACGRGEDFAVVARFLVRSWCRGAVFRGAADEVALLTQRFGRLLSGRFRLVVRVLMIWPGATRLCCRWISRFVRFFGLRRQLIRRAT